MRVSPRPLLGLVALVVYLVVVFVIQATSGVPYTELSASAGSLWRDPILSIAIASLMVAALATWWGWWRPALVERTRARRWTVIAPALVLVLAVVNLVFTRWSNIGVDFVIAGLVVGVLVGFGEEFTTRGLLLVGLRARLRAPAGHGSLIWPMALHGLWDFSVFVIGTSGASNPFGFLILVSAVVSVVFGFLATRDADGRAPSDAAGR
jgi:membrane protease YdiL (CAAX protease family)